MGLLLMPEPTEVLRQAAELLAWTIQPDGTLVPLGATSFVDMPDGSHPATASPGKNFPISGGGLDVCKGQTDAFDEDLPG